MNNINKINPNTKAFTLLEILVVIGIIMIIVGMVTSSYATAQKKARDSKRQTDLKTIQSAMEQYYSICGYQYPTNISSGIICPTGPVAIITSIPVDPLTTPYVHNPNTATSYTVCTAGNLETGSAPACVSSQQ